MRLKKLNTLWHLSSRLIFPYHLSSLTRSWLSFDDLILSEWAVTFSSPSSAWPTFKSDAQIACGKQFRFCFTSICTSLHFIYTRSGVIVSHTEVKSPPNNENHLSSTMMLDKKNDSACRRTEKIQTKLQWLQGSWNEPNYKASVIGRVASSLQAGLRITWLKQKGEHYVCNHY